MTLRSTLIAALAAASLAGLAAPASAATAAPTVALQVNHLTLTAYNGVKLAEGVAAASWEATLWLMPSADFWQLQPARGVILTSDGVISRRGPLGCRAARWGGPVASPGLRAGSWHCVMTQDGAIGEVKVERVTPTQVTISYTLWRGL